MSSEGQGSPVEEMSIEEIRETADRLGLRIGDEDVASVPQWVARTLRVITTLETPAEDASKVGRPREYRWATREEDPLNAFVTFCDVAGSAGGALHGLRVAVKDCLAVAGVPLTEGGGRKPYPLPSRDALVVARLLDAGATIVGKTNMEDMAVGSGVGSYFGPARNPVNPSYQTGGSSSGSAAAVGGGLADAALGTDQAGSVRIPAAWCGLVGMKPTHGLVPTQGMSRMDPTLDHIGPITKDVGTNERVLACLVGDHDDRVGGMGDERRSASPSEGGGPSMSAMRIGVVTQASHRAPLTDGLRHAFDDGLAALRGLGATVEDADVPLWNSSLPIFTGVVAHGLLGTWMAGGCGFGTTETLDEDWVEQAPIHRRLESTALPPRVLARLLVAAHVHRRLGGIPIARALNLRVTLTRQIEACLGQFDLLVTPTVCKVADPFPDAPPTRDWLVLGDGRELLNTVPLDLSGHPALTVPCGEADGGLPVGLQLIGPRFSEARLYMAASALERSRN
ncbi:MAG TPA: amidase family protein [Acidimicrobiales bacterium]|nr:amidase family protein [Acidimicrobiales bacterium]